MELWAAYCYEKFTVTNDGVFEGRALSFAEPDDNYGYTFEPSAFDASLEERGVEGVKMFYEHSPEQPIGAWRSIRRTDEGLFVRGKLTLETALAREVKALMEDGALDGLSVGFVIQEQDGNHIIKADLLEISVVSIPADRTARLGQRDGLRRYSANSSLPSAVRAVLPREAQTIYRKAYNKYAAEHPDAPHSRAAAVAWRAVKREFRPPEKEATMWVKKMKHDGGPPVLLNDSAVLDSSTLRRTSDGYLVADARVARTGIQRYLGIECGRPEMDVVRVYRPPEEVFSDATMHSFAHRPVTIEHPPEMLNDKNWKKYSVGHTGDEVRQEGKYLRVPLVLMDAEAIKEVEAGRRELSMGYTTELRFQSGVTHDGEEYDAVQTSIKANHLAIVAKARGGSELRIGDATRTEDEGIMPEVKTVTIDVDGVEVQVVDTSAAYLKKFLSAQSERLASMAKKLAEEEEEKEKEKEEYRKKCDAEIAAKDAEIAALQAKLKDAELTPAKLDAMVKDRAELVAKARVMLGDSTLVVDGRTNADIRKQVVLAKIGDAAKNYTDEQISVAFDTLAATASKTSEFASALADAQGQSQRSKVDAAYSEYNNKLTNAWRGKAAGA